MIRTLIAAIATVLLGCGAAFFQIGTAAPVPSPLGITSPLGMTTALPVSLAGVPLGTTELASPGLSPAPAATIGMTGNNTTCPVIGSPSSGISGSSIIYDGGPVVRGTRLFEPGHKSSLPAGMGVGTRTSLPSGTARSRTCGTALSSSALSWVATSPASPGGVARTNIPLGSGNAGVSPSTVVRRRAHIHRPWEMACHVRQLEC